MDESKNIDSMTPVQGFIATVGLPKERFEFLSSLRSIRNAPPVLDESNLAKSLAPVVIACFMDSQAPNKPELLRQFAENTESPDWLKDVILGQAANLVEAGREIGSHTVKIPNVSVARPGGLFAQPEIAENASKTEFVSSFTMNFERSIGAAGNAARTKAYRLLTSSFQVGDRVLEMAADIANVGPLSAALIELGFPADTIEQTRQAIKESMNGEASNAVDAAAKVLMWPIGDNDYVAITPVHSYAMHIEINKRLSEIRKTEGWINSRDINIGGSKPQNAGLINNEFGGRHPHLTGYPPTPLSVEGGLVWRMKNGHDLLRSYVDDDNEAPATFVRTVKNDSWNNKTSRDVLYRCIVAMAYASLDNVLAIRELLNSEEWEDQIVEVIEKLPTWIEALINENLRDQPDDVIEKAVEQVSAKVIEMIGTKKSDEARGVNVDTALRTLIEQTVSEFIVTV